MRKIALIWFASFAALFMAKAQSPPVITSANNFAVGDISILHTAVSTGINPGPSGANMIWDFSNLKSVTPPDSIFEKYLSSASTLYSKYFPNAEIAVESGDTTVYNFYNFYKLNNN